MTIFTNGTFLWPAFLLDLWLVAAFGITLASRWDCGGTVLMCLRAWVCASLLVVLSVLICGHAGVLRWEGLLGVHVLALLLLAITSRGSFPAAVASACGAPLRTLGKLVASVRRGISGLSWPGRIVAAGLMLLFGLSFLSALLAIPLNYDSHVYRLPRIGYWLQEARWLPIEGGSRHLHYSPFYGEFLMLWIVSFGKIGFPMIGIVQWTAGAALLGATWWMCRAWGYARFAALGAVLAVLACPNVAPQLSTSQTDLLVAGYAWAGLAILMPHGRPPGLVDFFLCGLSCGLAAGCKGTVFYFVAAAGVVMVVVLWRARVPWRRAVACVAAALVASVVVAAPPYAENVRRFGNPFGSPSAIEKFHGKADDSRVARFLETAELHLRNQFFAPSNPLLPAAWLEPINNDTLERADELTYLPVGRLKLFPLFGLRGRLNEDYSSFGILTLLLALAGVGVAVPCALSRREDSALLVVVLSLAGLAFLALFFSLYFWSPFASRFLTLLAPCLGVSVGYLLAALPRWTAMIAAGAVFVQGFIGVVDAEHHGFSIAANPGLGTHLPGHIKQQQLAQEVARRGGHLVIANHAPMWTGSLWRTPSGISISYPHIPPRLTATKARDILEQTGADVLLADDKLFPAGDELPPDRFGDDILFFRK
jgi:4-amino-4-deoxy-L-arabinose transferase-like glycosyltransferase